MTRLVIQFLLQEGWINDKKIKIKKKKEASGWTGINISFRNEVQVAQDVIG